MCHENTDVRRPVLLPRKSTSSVHNWMMTSCRAPIITDVNCADVTYNSRTKFEKIPLFRLLRHHATKVGVCCVHGKVSMTLTADVVVMDMDDNYHNFTHCGYVINRHVSENILWHIASRVFSIQYIDISCNLLHVIQLLSRDQYMWN